MNYSIQIKSIWNYLDSLWGSFNFTIYNHLFQVPWILLFVIIGFIITNIILVILLSRSSQKEKIKIKKNIKKQSKQVSNSVQELKVSKTDFEKENIIQNNNKEKLNKKPKIYESQKEDKKELAIQVIDSDKKNRVEHNKKSSIKKNIEKKSIPTTSQFIKSSSQQIKTKKVNLKLNSEAILFRADFIRKAEKLLENKYQLIDEMLPYFTLEFDTNVVFQLNRFYKHIKRNQELEHLKKLWNEGYFHSDLVILFALYYGNNEKKVYKILEFIAHPKINKIDKKVLEFIYQDIIGKPVSFQKFQNLIFQDKEYSQLEKLNFSIELNNSSQKWTFQNFEKHVKKNNYLQKDNYMNESFMTFIKKPLFIKADSKLKWKLFRIYESLYAQAWTQILRKHFYSNGSYTRSYENSSFIKAIQDPKRKKWNDKELKIIISQLLNKPLFAYHIVYFLIRANRYDFISQMKKQDNILLIIEKTFNPYLNKDFLKTKSKVNLFQRWVAFLYYYQIENYSMILKIYNLIGKYQYSSVAKMIYSKALYHDSQIEEAYKIVEKLLEKDPENLMYLNYAGILSTRLEKFDESEKYFNRALELYPKHKESKYNYNLFLEKKYSTEIKQNWQEYNSLG